MDDIGIDVIREFLMSAGFNVTDPSDGMGLKINGGIAAYHARVPMPSGTRARPGCNVVIKGGKVCVIYVVERTVREEQLEVEAELKTKIVDLHRPDGLERLRKELEDFVKLSEA